MLAEAKMVPTKVEPEPRVAELPTVQKTLHARLLSAGALMICTVVAEDVMSVDDAWKIHTAFGSPWASSVSVPLLRLLMGAVKL
jgi:hypothetical protein